MQKSELKQRQKKREDEQKSSSREEEQKRQHSAEKRRSEEERKRESDMRQKFRPDAKLCVSVMCVALSCVITWLFLQQSAALIEMRGKCESVQEKSRGFEELDKKLTEVSQQCAAVGALLSAPQGSAAPVSSHLSSLAVEVQRVQQGFSILSSEQQRLQRDLSVLHQAVQDVESRALLVSRDVSAKVSSVRTDVRRMDGLQTEVEALLNQTGALEEKVAQAEKLMVKRIGDALAGSIDRVSELKSAAERNGQRLEQVSALAHEVSEENRRLSERILALDSGQAKLRKMLRFAEDLKPKVFTVRQDFAMLEPRLSDLTLRIGLLAEDMMREGEAEECSDPRDETDPPTP